MVGRGAPLPFRTGPLSRSSVPSLCAVPAVPAGARRLYIHSPTSAAGRLRKNRGYGLDAAYISQQPSYIITLPRRMQAKTTAGRYFPCRSYSTESLSSDRIRHSAPQGFVAPDTIRPPILCVRKFYYCRSGDVTRNNASRNVCAPHTFGSEDRPAILTLRLAMLCTVPPVQPDSHLTSRRGRCARRGQRSLR